MLFLLIVMQIASGASVFFAHASGGTAGGKVAQED
jgi:hypothetical protein